MKAARPKHLRRGVALLEVMMALTILVGVAGSIFGIARISMNLSGEIVEKQRETMHRQAFFDLMRKQFSQLPGNTVVDLTFDDPPGNGPYLSTLTFQNVPMVFSWGGNPMAVKAVQIETVVRRDGYLDIVMKYYDREILEEDNATQEGSQDDLDELAEPLARVVLLEGVRWFEWQVLDSRSQEWLTEWRNPGTLPTLLQLDVAIGNEDNIRQIFWIAPKQNPVAYMRQLGLNGQAGQAGQAGQGQQGNGAGNGRDGNSDGAVPGGPAAGRAPSIQLEELRGPGGNNPRNSGGRGGGGR